MPQPFPDRFDPNDWQGPRARGHPKREDAFQQLIGHAAQEIHGLRAHVLSTSGRDGSIDIYVDDDPRGGQAFQGWPFPVILECKDHDEGGRDLAKNIQTGWRTVREKLARQAEAGWPSAFAPWSKARTYLYCLSSRLPSQSARDDLRNEILEFFWSIPEGNRPPLEVVAVLDWSDLRGWLDNLPRVADAWLGTAVPSIVGHEQFLKDLVGFRRYLLSEELPYVAPELDSSTHPDRLFERLVNGDSAGVLLVGVGGVGKTRLAIEVASRAVAAEWRVLHAGAGDSALEIDALASVVLSQGSRTLVVLDYLDQMHRLDPGALRSRLLPEARRRGQAVVLLATARPGASVLDHPEWENLFTAVALAPSAEQVKAITEEMLATLATHAEMVLGKESLRQLCGHRPILTLFLARELEHRAKEGILHGDQVTDLREGDLLRWLRLRLEENGIMVPAGHRLVPQDPEEAVVAAAAVLAAAPSSRAELIAAATVLLGERSDLAQPLVDNLAAFGWLEPSPREWSTAHDVVADEVLEQVLRSRPGTAVRPRALHFLLSASLRAPRILGRFALALRRLILASSHERGFAESVTKSACDWLKSVEEELAVALAAGDPDEAGYALGSVIAGPPWDQLVFERWDALLGPWLDRWKEERAARHLLYIGLRHREFVSAPLVEHALAWLRIHGHELEASFVLAQLFKRTEADSELVNLGLAWLERFPLEKEGQFVLHALLNRPDLGKRAFEIIDRSLAWLARFPLEKGAGYVLASLLSRLDLGERAPEAIDRGMGWLVRFPLEKDGQFVLHSLLDRPDLGERASEAIDRGMAWLARFPLEREAGYVLHSLLDRLDLGERGSEAIDRGIAWLERFPLEKGGQFVLHSLLNRSDLGGRASEAIDRGMAWLARFSLEEGADYVLPPLLSRPDLGERASETINLGLAWLAHFPLEKGADYVLPSLLSRTDLGEQASAAIDRGLAWLARFPLEKEACHVLVSLLSRTDLGEKTAESIDFGLAWLMGLSEEKEARFVLSILLERKDLGKWQRREAAVSLALGWLDRHYATKEPEFILKDLFLYYDLKGNDLDRCLRLALQRAEALPLDSIESSFLLRWVLSAKELTPAEEDRAVKLGLAWCNLQPFNPDASFVLKPILRRRSLSDEDWSRAALHAFAWLHKTPHERGRDYLILSCLARPQMLSEVELEFLRQDIFVWCQSFPEEQSTIENLQRGLRRAVRVTPRKGDLLPSPLMQVEDLRRWLEDPSRGSEDELLTREIVRIRELLDFGHGEDCVHYITLLLPLVIRWGSTVQQADVCDLARRTLAHLAFDSGQRAGFARACGRLLEENAWPDAEAGWQILRELGLTEKELACSTRAPLVKTEDLLYWAEHPSTGPKDELLAAGIEQAKELLGVSALGITGRHLALLLPMSVRWGSEAQQAEVRELTRSLLNHPQLRTRHRTGFVQSCLRRITRGAWADIEFGWRLLLELGLTEDELGLKVLDP